MNKPSDHIVVSVFISKVTGKGRIQVSYAEGYQPTLWERAKLRLFAWRFGRDLTDALVKQYGGERNE